MASMLEILIHDLDTGIINYGHANVMHKNESGEVLEFLDFNRTGITDWVDKLEYLVFDIKFTNYQNLKKLDDNGVRFVTICRRSKNLADRLEKLPAKARKDIRVEMAGNKKRTLKVVDEQIFLNGYNDTIRQISITGHGKIKPAIIITNDFDLSVEKE